MAIDALSVAADNATGKSCRFLHRKPGQNRPPFRRGPRKREAMSGVKWSSVSMQTAPKRVGTDAGMWIIIWCWWRRGRYCFLMKILHATLLGSADRGTPSGWRAGPALGRQTPSARRSGGARGHVGASSGGWRETRPQPGGLAWRVVRDGVGACPPPGVRFVAADIRFNRSVTMMFCMFGLFVTTRMFVDAITRRVPHRAVRSDGRLERRCRRLTAHATAHLTQHACPREVATFAVVGRAPAKQMSLTRHAL